MNKTYLKELFDKFGVLQEKRDTKFFEYFKSISTLSIALIGLLVGLKVSPIPNQHAKIAFLITIILIGLCVLFSPATRFYEVTFYNRAVELQKNYILKYVENPSENTLQVDYLDKPLFYTFSEIATYVCLSLSIISLISYVYFLEF